MKLTFCIYGLFLIVLVHSDSAENWKSPGSTRNALNRKMVENIKQLKEKRDHNARNITSETSNAKEESHGAYKEIKDNTNKQEDFKDSDSLKKYPNERRIVIKSVFNNRTETGKYREENVEKESGVHTKTNDNIIVEKEQELNTEKNQTESRDKHSKGNMKKFRKEITESRKGSKENIKTSRGRDIETNNKEIKETDKGDILKKKKDLGVEKKKELLKSYKNQEKNKDPDHVGTEIATHEKYENTNVAVERMNPRDITNSNRHFSKYYLPPHGMTEDQMRRNQEFNRKNGVILVPKKTIDLAELLERIDEHLRNKSLLSNKEIMDINNADKEPRDPESEQEKSKTISKDGNKLEMKAWNDSNDHSKEKAGESFNDQLVSNNSDKQTQLSLLGVNKTNILEEDSNVKNQSVDTDKKDHFLTQSDEFDDSTTQSIERTIANDPIFTIVTGNDLASKVSSANSKNSKGTNTDDTKEQYNVIKTLSGDSLKTDLDKNSMKTNQYKSTTVQKMNIIKEKGTKFLQTTQDTYPSTVTTWKTTATSATSTSQHSTFVSFKYKETTTGILHQMENRRTLNKISKADFENNLAKKSSSNPCNVNVDSSRQYTASAVVAAAVGGVFIGAFVVLVLFRGRQKCNKYINGDYRRVPMEYDFELNPRFKNR